MSLSESESEYCFSCLLDSSRRMGLIGIKDASGVSSSLLFFGLYFLLPDAHEPSTRSAMSSYKGNGLVRHCFDFGWLCKYMCIMITWDNEILLTLRNFSQTLSLTLGMFFLLFHSHPDCLRISLTLSYDCLSCIYAWAYIFYTAQGACTRCQQLLMDDISLVQLLVVFSEPANAAWHATQACFLGLLSPQWPLLFSSSKVQTRTALSSLVHDVFVDAGLELISSLVSLFDMVINEDAWGMSRNRGLYAEVLG